MHPKLYIFDLDGTLYRGSEAMPFAIEVLQTLRERSSQIRFLTNNSSRTAAQLAAKLNSLGFKASENQVYSSAMGAGKWLQNAGISRVFVVGEEGLVSTLAKYEVESVEEKPQAVVVGICRSFTYDWMNRALQHLLAGARFVATNTDATYPIEGGRVEPGAGAIVASIVACSGLEPVIIGKPEPLLIQMILEETGVNANEALVIGDRMETDMEAGKRAGCETFLVGTGVTLNPPDGQWFGKDLRELLAD